MMMMMMMMMMMIPTIKGGAPKQKGAAPGSDAEFR